MQKTPARRRLPASNLRPYWEEACRAVQTDFGRLPSRSSWLTSELFVSEAKRELKERMPYVEDGPDGPYWTTKSGIKMGLVGGIGSVGGKFVLGQNYRVDKMAETGLYEDGKKGIRRPVDPDQRIKDMDRDGVDAEIIFGILGVASRVRDPAAVNEMLRIYNDWLKVFCRLT
jgi:hypothetical protein